MRQEVVDYSQNGEQPKLARLLGHMWIKHKISVEFGAPNLSSCSNTRFLREMGWKCIYIDNNPKAEGIIKKHLTVDNINDVFGELNIPKDFEVLSIDIDGNDYWIWKALKYEPRIVVIEFNPNLSPDKSITIEYDENFKFNKTDYFGASFAAMKKLGIEKGYTLVTLTTLNLIFMKNEYLNNLDSIPNIHTYKHKVGMRRGWPPDKSKKKWIEV